MYDRSGTVMDEVSEFFPRGKLSGATPPSAYNPPRDVLAPPRSTPYMALRAMRGLGDAGEFDDLIPGVNYDIYTGTGYTSYDPVWSVTDTPTTVPPANEIIGGASLSQWAKTISDLYLLGKQAEAQGKIIDLNMQRAAQGKTPLPASMFQPQVGVNVGLSQQGQQMLKLGLLAAAAFLGVRMLSKR